MHVESYDSFEEMMEAENRRQLELLPLIEPWQKELTWGDTFAVYEPSADLWVFCRVRTEEELWPASALAEYGAQELAEEKEMTQATWERGFRPCENYSAWEPEGELADCHVLKALLKLTKEEFEAMRGIRWGVERFIEGEVDIAPEKEELVRATIDKLIRRVVEPGAVKIA